MGNVSGVPTVHLLMPVTPLFVLDFNVKGKEPQMFTMRQWNFIEQITSPETDHGFASLRSYSVEPTLDAQSLENTMTGKLNKHKYSGSIFRLRG